jgi:hypothetical protein
LDYRLLPAQQEMLDKVTKQQDHGPNLPVVVFRQLDLARKNFFVEAGNKARLSQAFVVQGDLKALLIFSDFQRSTTSDHKCHYWNDGGIDGPGWLTESVYDVPDVSPPKT